MLLHVLAVIPLGAAAWIARLWSDLAFSELDAGLPESRRRQTMTVQKALFDARGAFIGVLRVQPRLLPAPIAAALAFARAGGTGGTRVTAGGQAYLATLLPVGAGRTQGWLVGIAVPESFYVGGLTAARDRLLISLGAIVLAIAGAGLLGARTIGRGVATLIRSTEAMRRFEFEAGTIQSPFGEVRDALASVERAKTALRAMVKYVPVALVRRLYESGHEPVPSAELTEVSLMFTDIADFTAAGRGRGRGRDGEARAG